MEMSGEQVIPAQRERVWDMLNDPVVLRECIPGCTELEGNPEDGYTATVKQAIGPVKATFRAEISLSNLNYPESFTLSGNGKGGIAGFAQGGADVRLDDLDADTRLSYAVKAQVGGKIAQLGSRLIDSTARKLAEQFFANFEAHVRQQLEAPSVVDETLSP
jgi:carbon monoxide dehydrogenase subunit G